MEAQIKTETCVRFSQLEPPTVILSPHGGALVFVYSEHVVCFLRGSSEVQEAIFMSPLVCNEAADGARWPPGSRLHNRCVRLFHLLHSSRSRFHGYLLRQNEQILMCVGGAVSSAISPHLHPAG